MIMLFSAHKGRIRCIIGAAGAVPGGAFSSGRGCPLRKDCLNGVTGARLEAPGRCRRGDRVPGGVLVSVGAERGAGGRVARHGMEVELIAEFVDDRPVELATFRCPRCKRKLEELARARLRCPLCGVRMVKQKAGPSARVCSGQATAQAVTMGARPLF
jgi:DNA-directed RNA polymerase subunit RPC12/RpoP